METTKSYNEGELSHEAKIQAQIDREAFNETGPEENPGDGLVEESKVQGVQTPSAPVLNPGAQRTKELRNRLRSHANSVDVEVLNGEPLTTSRHVNQALLLRKHLIDLLNEGYGTIKGDANAVTLTVDLGNDVDYPGDDAQQMAAKEATARDDSTGETLDRHTRKAHDDAIAQKKERDETGSEPSDNPEDKK